MRPTHEAHLGAGHPTAVEANSPLTSTNLFRIGLMMVVAALMTLVFVGQANAQTAPLVVDDDGQAAAGDCAATTTTFDSIQEAVDAASPGDEIQVCPGTYDEKVTVNKVGLTLSGAQAGNDARTRTGSESVVDSSSVSGFAPTFNVTADDVTIDGFTIQGATDDPGILTDRNASGYTIVNNIIQNNTIGIYANSEGTNPTLIQHNLIQDNDVDGAASGTGIYADQGSINVDIDENELAGNDNAAIVFDTFLGPNTDLRITNNDITDTGIVLANVEQSVVSGNDIDVVLGAGITLGGNNDTISIRGNSITQATGAAIRLRTFSGLGDNANIEIIGNNLTGNAYGVRVAGHDGALEVHQNRIFDNSTAGIRNDDDEVTSAENNWWGCNEGPNQDGCDTTFSPADVKADPWLVLDVQSDPDRILTGGATSQIEARLLLNKGAGPVATLFPDGVLVDFATDEGTLNPDPAPTQNGVATTKLTSGPDEGTANVTATLDAETDSTTVRFTDCTITGTNGPDDLEGTPGADVICGLGGDDTIDGRGGNDELRGAGGRDTLSGNGGDDLVLGGAFGDRLFANVGEDDLFGQGGNDFLNTGDGDSNDLADGGSNTDTCQSDPGDTRVSCER
jgi:Ca2+-binding RTX toxin-like protein